MRIRFPYQLALLLASGLALWGCEVEPERTQLPPDVTATVDAAVSATLTATPPTAVPTPLSNPESTATPISAPTPTAAHSVTPTSTPLPTPRPTATARPTPLPTLQPSPTARPTPLPTPQPSPTARPTPLPTPQPSPTARPTLAPVRTAAKRSETITTSLGRQVDTTATGFADSQLPGTGHQRRRTPSRCALPIAVCDDETGEPIVRRILRAEPTKLRRSLYKGPVCRG